MADEREDERYEEGEYHFSDDQVNYEMDQPELKIPEAPAAGKAMSFLSKLTPARKGIIGGVVFIVLLSIVFKMLLPTGAPPTEFSQTEPNKPVVATAKPAMEPAKKPSAAQMSASAPEVAQPVLPIGQPTQSQNTVGTPEAQPAASAISVAQGSQQPNMQPTGAVPANVPTPVSTVTNAAPSSNQPTQPMQVAGSQAPLAGPNGSAVPQQSMQGPAPGLPMQQPAELGQNASQQPGQAVVGMPAAGTVVAGTPPQQVVGPEAPQGVVERLASLEQENAALMSTLRTDYVQKLSDYETQNTETRNKVDELSKRISHLEAGIRQVTQMLENMNRPAMATGIVEQATMAHPQQPKQIFTVQAIIPGRAWLKSDSGETITVAEGDLLRNYGRITKIDPYDGVVNIDIGNKIVTLSYGISPD